MRATFGASDSTAPTGQSVALAGGPYYTTLSVPLTLANGSDAQSGVDATSGVVERDSAPLANGSCGTFSGSWTTVTLVGGADTTVTSGNCYRYRYTISDNVGNQSSASASSTSSVARRGGSSLSRRSLPRSRRRISRSRTPSAPLSRGGSRRSAGR